MGKTGLQKAYKYHLRCEDSVICMCAWTCFDYGVYMYTITHLD